MELWTEYEGTVVDGVFPLKKLLRPEGRSAFFSTVNSRGESTVIRLVASHFDEEEILARWCRVKEINHPNILKLEHYGQLVMDETKVVYAVMEPVDANLAEVISGQRLTVSETKQLAVSLSSALDALHSHGFVHEHVDPANVFAVGDDVKLRGDCIRESPEGTKGLEVKRGDIHGLSVVLLQALTQKQTLEDAAHDLPLPSPFDQIVQKGMSGAWGVAEIAAALETTARVSKSSSQTAGTARGSTVAQSPVHDIKPLSPPKTTVAEPKTVVPPNAGRFRPPEVDRVHKPVSRTSLIVGAGLALILLLAVVWHLAHRRSVDQNSGKQATPILTPANPSVAKRRATKPSPVNPSSPKTKALPTQSNAAAGSREQWRVVAYTYNREDQAQKKSATIAQKHPKLAPQVFSPSGHAPYLVTIGGAMNREEAFALVKETRNLGFPRDVYAQNYKAEGR